MHNNLQKPATFRELPYNHRGIFNPVDFAKHVTLRCYAPSSNMEPFVSLYFVARYALPSQSTYTVSDVLTQPIANLFFTQEDSFIHGVTTQKREFHLRGTGLYAGIKFKPGGFHAFYTHDISEIAEKTIPITAVFPEAHKTFHQELLQLKDDQAIVSRLESILESKSPQPDAMIAKITEIVTKIEQDQHVRTVSDVAKSFDMNTRTLQHLFQTYVGVGIKWVIMRARFLEAVQYAYVSSDKPNWTKISIDLGYNTPSHFTNDFKKIVGMPPSKYVLLQQPMPQDSSEI